MSVFSVSQLRGLRRSLVRARNHVNKAIQSTSPNRSRLEATRAVINEQLAIVSRLLELEHAALNAQHQEGNP